MAFIFCADLLKPSSNYTGTEAAANLNSANANSVTVKAKWTLINYITNFDYTGGEQTWSAPYGGYYKLEVWGAQGGSTYGYYNTHGGYGAYAVGIMKIHSGTSSYVYVGGQGEDVNPCPSSYIANGGGYNGGGRASTQNDYHCGGGGGGATHIASITGLLSTLSSHQSDNKILIVAGGGGGSHSNTGGTTTHYANGGNAGGISGNNGNADRNGCGYNTFATGGTQTTGGVSVVSGGTYPESEAAFGKGCIARSVYSTHEKISGGAGWYGGGCCTHCYGTTGGGSSWIGNTNLISSSSIVKHMTCYSCTTSTVAATRTYSNTNVSATPTADYSKTGNGYARITWLGDAI